MSLRNAGKVRTRSSCMSCFKICNSDVFCQARQFQRKVQPIVWEQELLVRKISVHNMQSGHTRSSHMLCELMTFTNCCGYSCFLSSQLLEKFSRSSTQVAFRVRALFQSGRFGHPDVYGGTAPRPASDGQTIIMDANSFLAKKCLIPYHGPTATSGDMISANGS